MKKPGPISRRVNSPRNSDCGSAKLADLDWSNWWTDGNCRIGKYRYGIYIHVRRCKEGPDFEASDRRNKKYKFPRDFETWHRVYCRATDNPRLSVKEGQLYWLIDKTK